MWETIGKSFAFLTRGINILDIWLGMAEKRTKHLDNVNDHDITKAQIKLNTAMAQFQAENKLITEGIISPDEFKPVAEAV